MTDSLKYTGVFEHDGHDCTKHPDDRKPRTAQVSVDEEWGLGHRGRSTQPLSDEEARNVREARDRNRRGSGHNVV